MLYDVGAARASDLQRAVGAEGVDHEDLIGPGQTVEAFREVELLVKGRHQRRDRDAHYTRPTSRSAADQSLEMALASDSRTSAALLRHENCAPCARIASDCSALGGASSCARMAS